MRELKQKRSYHFIGIGGIGVSAVARVLHQRGAHIQGSDVRESQLTEGMRRLGVRVEIGHDPKYIEGQDFVVYSTAVPKENVELYEAQKKGVTCLHRSEALNHCLEGLESVGVTGTHGKGTVSAMIAHGLITAELDPTFIIGGILNQYGVNAHVGRLPSPDAESAQTERCFAVAEVDESDGSHLNLQPQHVVVNNLEVDHLNYYDDLTAIIDTMATFINRNKGLLTLSLNWGDSGVRHLAERLEVPYLRYASESDLSDSATLDTLDFTARNINDRGFTVSFDAYHGARRLGAVTLPIPGGYNAANAAGALSVLIGGIGLNFERVRPALNTYQGLENRFTVRRAQGVTIVKDYLSHPTGMKKVLDSAQRFDHERIWCVFKPYRFTLMRYHGRDYAEAFLGANQVLITKMYAADEVSISGIDTPWFVSQLREAGNQVHYLPEQGEITAFLEERVRTGDMVFFFGGDDFFRMADAWADQREGASKLAENVME